MACDVLLLAEVSERLDLDEYEMRATDALMAPRRRWAAVLGPPGLLPLPDPHPASALAVVDGWTFCNSILPWRSCGTRDPWIEGRHADKTAATVDELLSRLPLERLVWGGDWNHALQGREYSGSIEGRRSITAAVEKIGLSVPTAQLPHAIDGLLSIDHIAVPMESRVVSAERYVAAHDGRRLSDHDAYVVTFRTW
jgi:hypothetical protein